jgi:hypothetical protein
LSLAKKLFRYRCLRSFFKAGTSSAKLLRTAFEIRIKQERDKDSLGGLMKRFLLVLVFAVSFVLKTSMVFGAGAKQVKEPAKEAPIETAKETTQEIVKKTAKVKVTNTANGDKNSKEEEVGSGVRIENNITFGQGASPIDCNNSTDLKANASHTSTAAGLALIPMAGGTSYAGSWNNHIRNSYTFGVALELSIIPLLSIEAEVGQGRYYINYSNYGHNFTQYTYGGTAKFYLTRGIVQTYAGAGVVGLTYQNMTHGMNSNSTYDTSLGAGQALVGADIALSNQVSIGVRGSYIQPLFNRPANANNDPYNTQYSEENSAMNSAMYRLMGAVKVSL